MLQRFTPFGVEGAQSQCVSANCQRKLHCIILNDKLHDVRQ
jgi:hypothetical protein